MYLKKEQMSSLHDILTRKKLEDFQDLGGTLMYHPNDPGRACLYIRTSEHSKVLAVGHTDYVVFTDVPKMSTDGTKVYAGQLDDRLGVWLITSILPQILSADMPYDILLTDFEEKGQSTASLFNPPEGKEYNWIFEWDRRGDEVVMYDYETKELKELLQGYGFKVGNGSFTDICQMGHLGVAAFNFGVCYYGEHNKDSYASLPELIEHVKKFQKMYVDNYHTKLEGNSTKVASQSEWKRKWLHEIKPKGEAKVEVEESPFLIGNSIGP